MAPCDSQCTPTALEMGLQALGVSCSVITGTKVVVSAQAKWIKYYPEMRSPLLCCFVLTCHEQKSDSLYGLSC